MEPEGSLPHSQVPDTCPYPEPSRSIPYPHIPLLEEPSTFGSPKRSLSFRFHHQNPVYTSPLTHTRYMPRPSHSSRFYHPNNLGKEYRSLSSSLCSLLHSPVTSSLLGPNILINTLFSNALSLISSLNLSDQFSHIQNNSQNSACACVP